MSAFQSPNSSGGAAGAAVLSRAWYREPWLWLVMAGPILVVIAGVYTAWLAARAPDAVVVDDYYSRGKAINQDLRRDRNAAVLGLSLRLHHDAAAGKLTGTLAQRGAAWTGPIQLQLIHATRPERDLRFIVPVRADGGFEVALPALEATRWQVLVEGSARDWRLSGTWGLPRQAELALDATAD